MVSKNVGGVVYEFTIKVSVCINKSHCGIHVILVCKINVMQNMTIMIARSTFKSYTTDRYYTIIL